MKILIQATFATVFFLHNFAVTDGVDRSANTVGPFPFEITILPTDNAPPIFRDPSPTLQVIRGEYTPIRNYLVDVTDADTRLSSLVYTVTLAPAHGSIYKSGLNPTYFRTGEFLCFFQVLHLHTVKRIGGGGPT